MAKPTIAIYPSGEAFYTAAAELFIHKAQDAVATQGSFCVALCGGNTPKPIYQLLAKPEYAAVLPWDKISIFWGDERCVPHDNADSNYQMTRQVFLDHVCIPAAQIHPIPFLASPQASAAAYEATLKNFFANRPPQLDLVFLGLGDDGHTASLFPHAPVLHEKTAWVQEVFVPKLNAHRITLTAPLINQAATVAFLVEGDKKASILQRALEGPKEPDEIPAQLICPLSGDLLWLTDQAAAVELTIEKKQ